MNTPQPSCLVRQFLIQLAKENSYRTILRSVRTIVSTVVNSSGSGAPVGTSPVFTTGLGGCGAGEPVVGISPAEAVPESTHARTSANAKCLILSLISFELRNASRLARKQHSVNTYSAIDTASRGVSNIQRW